MVAVNLLSIVLFIKNSDLRTRSLYLNINLTVADMIVGAEEVPLSLKYFFPPLRLRSWKFIFGLYC